MLVRLCLFVLFLALRAEASTTQIYVDGCLPGSKSARSQHCLLTENEHLRREGAATHVLPELSSAQPFALALKTLSCAFQSQCFANSSGQYPAAATVLAPTVAIASIPQTLAQGAITSWTRASYRSFIASSRVEKSSIWGVV